MLVGTTSIESSELLAGLLDKEGIQHEVLNAKQHEREAHVVAQAGWPGAVTIATNMAGRGTDIVLGGNLEAELAALPEDADERRSPSGSRREWQKRHEEVLGRGRLAHHRHRAARVPAHRQPAARPVRPPGRSGILALLPVDGRQR